MASVSTEIVETSAAGVGDDARERRIAVAELIVGNSGSRGVNAYEIIKESNRTLTAQRRAALSRHPQKIQMILNLVARQDVIEGDRLDNRTRINNCSQRPENTADFAGRCVSPAVRNRRSSSSVPRATYSCL